MLKKDLPYTRVDKVVTKFTGRKFTGRKSKPCASVQGFCLRLQANVNEKKNMSVVKGYP